MTSKIVINCYTRRECISAGFFVSPVSGRPEAVNRHCLPETLFFEGKDYVL